MNKLTQISGVDNKIGRNSRTGSNITINVPDDLIMDVTQYYASVRANKEPTGRIKKIELVMYDESDLKEEPDIIQSMNILDSVINNVDEIDPTSDEEPLSMSQIGLSKATNQPGLDIYDK